MKQWLLFTKYQKFHTSKHHREFFNVARQPEPLQNSGNFGYLYIILWSPYNVHQYLSQIVSLRLDSISLVFSIRKNRNV